MRKSPFHPGIVLLDKYLVERTIGNGGMGSVLSVRHEALDEKFAIKILHPGISANGSLQDRFLREARVAARLKSDHAARVFDVGRLDDGSPYMVMELLTGSDLAAVLASRGKMGMRQVITYILQACDAIAEAHQLGVVHHDIKPANLFLAERPNGAPTIKVLDFGIAKLISTSAIADTMAPEAEGVIAGTPAYMSPEQCRGLDRTDARSDIWSIGVTLFELVTGTRPFHGENVQQLLIKVASYEGPLSTELSASLPSQLDAVVVSCLQKQPEKRFQSVQHLTAALRRILSQTNFSDSAVQTSAPIDVFLSYADADAIFRTELVTHLAQLQREGAIRRWDAGAVLPGSEWQQEAARKLDDAHVILVLLSPDYLASEYLYQQHLRKAMTRRSHGARVIPILVRSCDWASTPWGHVHSLPSKGLPIAGWGNRDDAWAEVVIRIRETLHEALRAKEIDVDDTVPTPRWIRTAAIGTPKALNEPKYPTDTVRILSERIEAARVRKLAIEAAGSDAFEVAQEILTLRRQLREDGQLKAGDSLSDGRYLLLQQLGRGGFATVWKATDRSLEQTVAIKVLHSHLAGDPLRVARFYRGARIMAQLMHPGIVRVIEEQGSDAGWSYFIMEFIPCGDFRQAVLSGRIKGERVVPTLFRISEALSEAHRRKIVHRDVKPANILLDMTGAPRLADFDLVCAADTTGGTRTGALGTFMYAAPEVLDRPQEADARADVYGLGMTAVFAFYGAELPYTIQENRGAFVRSLRCSEKVKDVLLRAIHLSANERFPDALAFHRSLWEAATASQPKGWRAWFSKARY